ncbi:MFS transporter [Saccharophagus degradans]|uniref:MFS transporter n=1 Tax=Saccharophagus degradans TaxID=86304 RepID=A0AAW7X8V9_9GAMM|nr:MFS transporter [Saccharophagus degradans]MDO6423256.1 MFS transporter [Saccharophagus degradans]MDO6607220.1 MFS transporter [Saccharophagus degradans]
MAQDRTGTISLKEKIGYGFGDAASNFYWAIIGSYLVFFYTDIFGISAKSVAIMMVVTKLIDACTDPAIGAIADRTNTRWGKFRPYLLFGALPMAGAAVLTMSTPDLGDTGKLVWAYITYTLMMLTYTILNLPYSSLAGVITANTAERNSLFSIRFFCAYFTSIIVGAATPDLAAYFGQGDDAKGWQMTMMLYACVATILFWITFASTKERVSPPVGQKTNPIDDIKDLLKNRAWVVLFALALIIMVTIVLRGSSAPYYFKYFVERPDLMGSFIGLQMAAYAVGALSYPFLLRRIGDKAKLLTILMATVGVLCIVFAFIPKPTSNGVVTITQDESITLDAAELLGEAHKDGDSYQWTYNEKVFWIIKNRVAYPETGPTLSLETAKGEAISVIKTSKDANGALTVLDSASMPIEIYIMFILNILISLALGPKSPLTWSMLADAADYNEWKTGRRATGMTFSAASFSQKMGGMVGSVAIGAVLASIGYTANEAQSDGSQTGIVILQTAAPGVFAFVAIFALRFYNLTGSKIEQIQKELAER